MDRAEDALVDLLDVLKIHRLMVDSVSTQPAIHWTNRVTQLFPDP
jgi:hypothetical protein